jgi:hypothetical protein
MNENYAKFRQAQTIEPHFCIYLRKMEKISKIRDNNEKVQDKFYTMKEKQNEDKT